MANEQDQALIKVPRIAITYCTQCRWMLRAAYFGQELLSTFNTSIGEIALIPATGGIFTVELTYHPLQSVSDGRDASTLSHALIWDRKAEGGFPEAKILKQRVRNLIEPDRHLGHSDTPSTKSQVPGSDTTHTADGEAAIREHPTKTTSTTTTAANISDPTCSDCA